MKKLKQTKGITLIALIITIIILLILAMVTIKILINEGIIGKAREGVDNYTVAEEKEQIQLGYSEYKMQKLSNNEATLSIEGATVEGEEATGWTITFNKTGNAYTLSSEGTIAEPFDAEEWDKTASDEDCFIWKSDDSGSEDYGVVIGYTKKIDNYSKLVFPSRCTNIEFIYEPNRYNGMNPFTSRSYTNNILQVEIPGTVKEIGTTAFGYGPDKSFEKLETINIKTGLTNIGIYAFQNCTNLSDITIPDSVTSIGEHAFDNTAWLNKQADGVVYAGKVVYTYKGEMQENTIINIEEGTKSISDYAFQNCINLSDITIPDSVICIGQDAFDNTAWYNNQEDGLIYAGKVAYKYKGEMKENTTIDIQKGSKGIAGGAFSYCTNLSNISIPDSVTSIGRYAFYYCTNLSNIIVWKNVDKVGNRVFAGWEDHQTINIEAKDKPEGWDKNWNQFCGAKIVWGYTGD